MKRRNYTHLQKMTMLKKKKKKEKKKEIQFSSRKNIFGYYLIVHNL